jgi:hypothetical protein
VPKTNPYLKAAMLEAVEEQMKELPEARATFERLVSEGHSEREAKKLIAAVLAWELFNVVKEQRPFQHEGYVRALDALPTLPD